MKNSITVRKAVAADLPAIVAIYNSTISSRMVTADTEPVTIEERRPWFIEHQTTANRPLWAAEYDGTLCGWLSLSNFYGRPAYRGTAEISIYLDHAFRGRGIGSSLLHYALDQASDLEIKTILAFIFGQNKPSLHLFERFGFEAWGTLPKVAELDDNECDLIIMGKRVNP
jgi:phosphinothricin acetyltransferase